MSSLHTSNSHGRKVFPRVRAVRSLAASGTLRGDARGEHGLRQAADDDDDSTATGTTTTATEDCTRRGVGLSKHGRRGSANRRPKDLHFTQLPGIDVFRRIFATRESLTHFWAAFAATAAGATTNSAPSTPLHSRNELTGTRFPSPPPTRSHAHPDSHRNSASAESLHSLFAQPDSDAAPLGAYLRGVPPPDADTDGPTPSPCTTFNTVPPSLGSVTASPVSTAGMLDRSLRYAAASPLPTDLIIFESALRRSIEAQHRAHHLLQLMMIVFSVLLIAAATLNFIAGMALTLHWMAPLMLPKQLWLLSLPMQIGNISDVNSAETLAADYSTAAALFWFVIAVLVGLLRASISLWAIPVYLTALAIIHYVHSSSHLSDQTSITSQLNGTLERTLGLHYDQYSAKLIFADGDNTGT